MQIVSIILDFALIAVTLLAVQRAERAAATAEKTARRAFCRRECAAPAENPAPAEMPVPDFERSVAAIMTYSGTRKPEERS